MRRIGEVLKQEYGEKVYRLALSSGATCPNRDGTIGSGGCTFCSLKGSGEFAAAYADIETQIEQAKQRIRAKTDARLFIAYFQAFTNTYGDPKRLFPLYKEAISHPDVVILSLATRPDCLDDAVLDMLEQLNRIKPVWIELGLQTMHETTAERIHRGYKLPVFEEAVRNLHALHIPVIVHLILGLPGETREDMLETGRYVGNMYPMVSGVKIQMLNILEGSLLGEEYRRHPFDLLSLEEYAALTAELIGLLPEEMTIHRMSGDGPADLLIAPQWVRNKKRVLNTINRLLRETGKGEQT